MFSHRQVGDGLSKGAIVKHKNQTGVYHTPIDDSKLPGHLRGRGIVELEICFEVLPDERRMLLETNLYDATNDIAISREDQITLFHKHMLAVIDCEAD